jgi:hypothetical protein
MKIPREIINAFYINDTCLLLKSWLPWQDEDVACSYIKYNPVTEQITDEYRLYSRPVTSDMAFTGFASIADCIKPDRSKIANLTFITDQIDIFDINNPDNSFSVTENNHKEILGGDREYYTRKVKCTDNLIFALYRNQENNRLEMHIIDWDGNPVCKLLLDRELFTFEIDDNGFMYGLENETERIYKYNTHQINEK